MNYSHVSPATLNIFINKYQKEIISLQLMVATSTGLAREVFIIRIEELESKVEKLEQTAEQHGETL